MLLFNLQLKSAVTDLPFAFDMGRMQLLHKKVKKNANMT